MPATISRPSDSGSYRPQPSTPKPSSSSSASAKPIRATEVTPSKPAATQPKAPASPSAPSSPSAKATPIKATETTPSKPATPTKAAVSVAKPAVTPTSGKTTPIKAEEAVPSKPATPTKTESSISKPAVTPQVLVSQTSTSTNLKNSDRIPVDVEERIVSTLKPVSQTQLSKTVAVQQTSDPTPSTSYEVRPMRDTSTSIPVLANVNQKPAVKSNQESQSVIGTYTNQGKAASSSNAVGKTYETLKYDKVDDALLNKISMYNQYAEVRNLSKEQSSDSKKNTSGQTASSSSKYTILNDTNIAYANRISTTKVGNGNAISNVIKLGDSGTDIFEVQRKLQTLGMLQGGSINGKFDESTLNALNKFKNEYGYSKSQDKKDGVLNQNTMAQLDQKIKGQELKANALVEGQQKQKNVEYYEKNERVHTKEELEKIKTAITRMDTMKEIARVAGPGRVAQIESNSRFADETLKAMPEIFRVAPYTGVAISTVELITDKNIYTNEKLTEKEKNDAKINLVLSGLGMGAASKYASPIISSAKGVIGNLIPKLDDVAKVVQKADDIKLNTVNNIPNGPVKPEVVQDVVKTVEGAGKLVYKADFADHLINAQGIVRKGNKGVVGGHNFDSFKKILIDQGWSLDELIISQKSHPTIKGVYEINYQIPALDAAQNSIKGQYKNIPFPKTVYDPKLISNETMVTWGKEAMEQAFSNNTISGRVIDGIAKNGLKFRGYIDEATGEITNFFPVFE